MTLVAAACPSATDPPSPTPRSSFTGAPSARPATGGTLRVALAEDVDALDPHVAASPAAWWFIRALHRGLLAYPRADFGEGARPVPDLAAALPRVGAGGRRLTFVLRAGTRFGGPASGAITSGDVRASLERVVRGRAGIASALDVIIGVPAFRARRATRISGVSTPNVRTVVLRLSRVAPGLPWVLAHPQMAIVPEGTRAPGGVAPSGIAGAGPYRIRSYEPERSLSLVRNQGWGADPVRGAYVDRIDARFGIAPAAAVRDVASGKGDVLLDAGPPDTPFPSVREPGRMISSVGGCVRFLFLNVRSTPFRSAGVRRAVASAVQRAALAVSGEPATAILPPTITGSGAPLVIEERVRPVAPVSATLTIASAPRDRAEAQALRQAIARAGVRLHVIEVSPAALHAFHYERRRAQAGIGTWCADHPGLAGANVLGALTGSGKAAYSGMGVPPAVRAALRAGGARAEAAWRSADRAVQAGAAIIPLTWPVERIIVSERLRGLEPAPMWPRSDPTALWLVG